MTSDIETLLEGPGACSASNLKVLLQISEGLHRPHRQKVPKMVRRKDGMVDMVYGMQFVVCRRENPRKTHV